MDGYLSKPIATEALWVELESIKSSPSPSVSINKGKAASREYVPFRFDLQRALSLMGDDMDIFNEMVGIYLVDYPIRLEQLRNAIDARDIESIRQAAHSIRGMVSVFSVPEVNSIAQRLEVQPGNELERNFAELATALSWLAGDLSKSANRDHSNLNVAIK
jgi:HPt (histidine-containing phosphotransfer) domain-containing protein